MPPVPTEFRTAGCRHQPRPSVVGMKTQTHPAEPQPTLFDRPVGLVRVPSPLGRLELASDGTAITGLQIERDGRLPRDGFREASTDLLVRAAEQLSEYFDGTRERFDLPLALEGTEFQRRIWTALSGVPFGASRTYGQLGHDAGLAIAGRAVGGAVRSNPAPLLIPCHRALASGGRVVGYSQGAGIPTKRWLLEHEGIPYRA